MQLLATKVSRLGVSMQRIHNPSDSLLPRWFLIARPKTWRRRTYLDWIWTLLYVFFSILLTFAASHVKVLFQSWLMQVFLHVVPILTFIDAGTAYLHMYLLRILSLVATEVFEPQTKPEKKSGCWGVGSWWKGEVIIYTLFRLLLIPLPRISYFSPSQTHWHVASSALS